MDASESGAQGSLRDLVVHWRTPLLITTLLAVFQQLTGNANILNYTSEIFEMVGLRGSMPIVVLGLVKVVATLVAILKVSSEYHRDVVCTLGRSDGCE